VVDQHRRRPRAHRDRATGARGDRHAGYLKPAGLAYTSIALILIFATRLLAFGG
jgi:hypothetical protein